MGAAADLKVTEIEKIRQQVEDDLRELEARLPAPLRSAKSAAGLVLRSTILAAFFPRALRSTDGHQARQGVVRIVRGARIAALRSSCAGYGPGRKDGHPTTRSSYRIVPLNPSSNQQARSLTPTQPR